MRDTTHAVYFVGVTIIAMLSIYFAGDREDGVPMMQFALVFGGALLGHIITEVLNATEEE